jgi:hypothetical protein
MGEKVILFLEITVYVPSPSTVSEVSVQLGATCCAPHKRIDLDAHDAELATTSFFSGSMVFFSPRRPLEESFFASDAETDVRDACDEAAIHFAEQITFAAG